MKNTLNDNQTKILQMAVRIGRTKPPWSDFFTRLKWELGIGRKEWVEIHRKPPLVQPIDWNLVKKDPIYAIHRPTAKEIAEEKRIDMEEAHFGHTILEKPYSLAELEGKNPRGTDILTFVRELPDGTQLWTVDDIGYLSGWGGYVIVRDGMVISEKCTMMAYGIYGI